MSHYKSNLRDIEFNLFELLDRHDVLGVGPFADLDGETVREILSEVERLAREDLAASLADSGRNPPVFDPKMRSEYWRLPTMSAPPLANEATRTV